MKSHFDIKLFAKAVKWNVVCHLFVSYSYLIV